MVSLFFLFSSLAINLLHLNWHAFSVRLGKCTEISLQPSFFSSFRCLSNLSSSAVHMGDPNAVFGESAGGGEACDLLTDVTMLLVCCTYIDVSTGNSVDEGY